MIVGWEIHHMNSSAHALYLISKACLPPPHPPYQWVLHSDNGSPMKRGHMLGNPAKVWVWCLRSAVASVKR